MLWEQIFIEIWWFEFFQCCNGGATGIPVQYIISATVSFLYITNSCLVLN
jgi:hypothetical protein